MAQMARSQSAARSFRAEFQGFSTTGNAFSLRPPFSNPFSLERRSSRAIEVGSVSETDDELRVRRPREKDVKASFQRDSRPLLTRDDDPVAGKTTSLVLNNTLFYC